MLIFLKKFSKILSMATVLQDPATVPATVNLRSIYGSDKNHFNCKIHCDSVHQKNIMWVQLEVS